MFLSQVGLLDDTSHDSTPAQSFEEVISRLTAHRLSSALGGSATNQMICPIYLQSIFQSGFDSDELELGHTMSEAVREDALCVWRRDPASETLLEVVLFLKGFLSLVVHRAARRAWNPIHGTRFVALFLQSQASSAFGVDIHPAAQIGAGVMMDHATGVVIGETATVGDGTTILHGVTLGGTGKESGDRHPKIGRDVLIGAGTQILGNIRVGDRVKIGAGSVVLRSIPTGATAVGSPAKIIGFTPKGERPGSSVDISLAGVEPLMGSVPATATSAQSTPLPTTKSTPLPTTIPETIESMGETDDDNTSDSDDDQLTDFGTPAKLHYVNTSHNDNMCPFRNSFRQTSVVCKDMISHKKLRALLLQEGCTDGETVEVFFGLLHLVPNDSQARRCGCIPLETFATYFPEIGAEKTRLGEETCMALAKGDLRILGMSKKASKKFRTMFERLGSIASSPSFTSLGCQQSAAVSSSNDEEKREYALLDTTGYAEEIAI